MIISITCFFHSNIEFYLGNVLFDKFDIVLKDNNMLVHFVSVGQGDAIVINLPDGKTMLIDAGPKNNSVDYTNYLDENILNSITHNKLDYVVLTHADADHIGGALRVLKNYDVQELFMPRFDKNTQTYNDLKAYVDDNFNYKIIDETFVLHDGDYSIKAFALESVSDTNESCPIIKVEYLGTSFLFTGDITEEIEQDFVNRYGSELDCDILKIAHHGSAGSTSQSFLNATTPTSAVIQVGVNPHGHPTDQVLFRLNVNDAEVYRTDTLGDVLFAVGESYGTKVITGNYMISGINFDFRLFILFIDIILLFNMLSVLKKPSKTDGRRQK